ncbi:MAG: ATP-binding protein [Elusimicrobia bacterium]|nr:ATP-binding protein [Elusimicrobiota bacterium]
MKGIFKRLFVTYVFIIVVSSTIIAVFADYVFKEYYRDEIAHELEISAVLVDDILGNVAIFKNTSELQSLVKRLEEKIKDRITIVGLDGFVIADSESNPKTMENHKNRPEIERALSGVTGKSIRYSNTLNVDMMYVAIPLRFRGKTIGAIRLSMPLNNVNKKIKRIHKIIIVAVFIGILAALLLSLVVGKSFVKPILIMRAVAEKISKGDFSQKLDFKSYGEIAQLGNSLNVMSEELQKKISEIIKEKNELSAVLSSMSEGVLVVEESKKIVLINPALSKMLYFRSEDVAGKYYWEVIGNEEINSFIESAMGIQQSLKKDITILLPEEHHIEIHTSSIFYDHRKLFGIVCVFHDMTQIKKLEKVRTEFVANASHELKTPLTAIIGFVETLKEGAINDREKAMEFLSIIQDNTTRLKDLVNDLLTISMAESREFKLNLGKVNLKELINSILVVYKSKMESKKQKIIKEVSADIQNITVDEEKFRQIISNLIDNAVKFTGENGEIKIKCLSAGENIRIEISDTGIGISKEHLPRIFERFYRVDTARSREMGGTGLGLAIVKHLVMLHKGNVFVESQPGKGSVFTIVLPK